MAQECRLKRGIIMSALINKQHRWERKHTRNVGDPSSEFGYDRDGSKFEAALQAHFDRAEFLWSEFVKFMQDHDVTPAELRHMFTRYYEEFIK